MSLLRIVLLVMLAAATASALGVAQARQESRALFAQLERLQRERDEINIEWAKLQLELATWAETNRIEQIARRELGMRFPEPHEIIVVLP